jgi:hypothetical protein
VNNLPPWLTIAEAAALLRYHPDYFRRTFCDPEHPKVSLYVNVGPKGGRTILVNRDSLLDWINGQVRTPV